MKENDNNDRLSMVSALSGTLLIIVTLITIAAQIQRITEYAAEIYESGVLVQLELDGLQKEQLALESVLRAAESVATTESGVEVAGIFYTLAQIDRLRAEHERYENLIVVKRETLTAITQSKRGLLIDLQVLFWAGLFVLLVGIIMAVLGYLSWFHRLRIFRDRRAGPRKEDLQAFTDQAS
jgi:uncharacterized membrane protein YidH (DUF202 family)